MNSNPNLQNIDLSSPWVLRLCWCLLLATIVLAYWPGLSGPFVVDDFATLEALGYYGGVTDWQTFVQFVFGGNASPTGRPISLLTYLLDASDWPAEPGPFKRTNLVIHMVNGVLLGWLIRRLLSFRGFDRASACQISLVCAGIWLLHPFLVSTTLYVVQRMAELSALFVFAGILGYTSGRSLVKSRPRRAYLLMGASIVVFTSTGILAKENAVLLPLLIWVVEWTICRDRSRELGTLDRKFTFVFMVAPAVAIFGYLAYLAFNSDFFAIVPPRDFSLFERLLSQPRVLLDYMLHWLLPRLYTAGVFQDHFIHSTSLWSPISTVLSLGVHVLLLSAAIRLRKSMPLLTLALLFFYVGHLLESTTLNLELYFEHRNYLPASFLFLPIVVFLQQKLSVKNFAATSLLLLVLLAGFTRYSANIWSDFPSMVAASARKAPTSARAQADYANSLFNSGRYEESVRVLDTAIQNIPHDRPHLLLSQLTILCRLNMLSDAEFAKTGDRLSQTTYDPRLTGIYHEFVTAVADRHCENISMSELRSMFAEMLALDANAAPGSVRNTGISYFIGIVDTYDRRPARAIESFNAVLQANPNAHTAFNIAKLFASNGYFDVALKYSARARSELSKGQRELAPSLRTSESEITEFETRVRTDSRLLTGSGEE